MTHKLRFTALLLLLSAFLSGCATPGSSQSGEVLAYDKTKWESLAVARADERWRLIGEKKFDQAFEYFTVASRRDVTSTVVATQARNLRVESAKADSAVCTPEQCEVTINLTVNLRIPRVGNKQQTFPFKEYWAPEAGTLRLIRQS